MLPKKRRIPREMFPLLSKEGRIYKNSLFFLRLASQGSSQSRFGFSVSKKISKSAAQRNRLRRIGYRLVRAQLGELRPNYCALISYLKRPKDGSEIELALNDILKKSNLI